MGLREVGLRAWTGLIWLRIGADSGLFHPVVRTHNRSEYAARTLITHISTSTVETYP
jgi:hypothetical protein